VIESPLQLGTFSSLHAGLMHRGAVALFLAGVFLITALFHFALLLGQRNKWTYGVFSAFCFFCSVYIFIQTRLSYFQLDLVNYDTLAFVNDIPWFFMIALLPMFFLYEFSFPLRNRLSALIATTALLVVVLPRLVVFGLVPLGWLNGLVLANQIHTYITFALAIGVAVWASYRRMAGARTAAIGLVVFFIGVWMTYVFRVENSWAVGFAILIIFLTASLARHMAQANRRHQEAQLRSARLELELLKKHIQPHFLLNSLNSIVAWLEEDPQTASRLVNALADELRMLLTFSGKPLIPLAEEVRLCTAHLQVMGLRQEKEFGLQVDCREETVQLPPLIMHTLLENGLTHGYAGRDRGSFVLRCCRQGQTVRFALFNDGAVSAPARRDADGTGLRYVKSRLEEAFPGRWRLQSGPVAGGWEVTIDVEHVA
jgi:two-component sensor histidine kinase